MLLPYKKEEEKQHPIPKSLSKKHFIAKNSPGKTYKPKIIKVSFWGGKIPILWFLNIFFKIISFYCKGERLSLMILFV